MQTIPGEPTAGLHSSPLTSAKRVPKCDNYWNPHCSLLLVFRERGHDPDAAEAERGASAGPPRLRVCAPQQLHLQELCAYRARRGCSAGTPIPAGTDECGSTGCQASTWPGRPREEEPEPFCGLAQRHTRCMRFTRFFCKPCHFCGAHGNCCPGSVKYSLSVYVGIQAIQLPYPTAFHLSMQVPWRLARRNLTHSLSFRLQTRYLCVFL